MNPKIVMLVGKGESSRFMFNALKRDFDIIKVIEEGSVNKKRFLERRIKRLGVIPVLGQGLFQFFLVPVLRTISNKRIRQIITEQNLDSADYPKKYITKVSSVNSIECLNLLKDINPELIIVNGTRIISEVLLNTVDALFINTHVGITPKYRGVHGGYWALANDDPENCGVTVHQIDLGIDTGKIFHQATIKIKPSDNFVTYVYLQVALGIKIMKQTITDYQHNILNSKTPENLESKLWYHPTIWFYLKTWLIKGVN